MPLEKGIDENGRMTELAGKYAGMTVVDARRAIIEDMKAEGTLVKQEPLDQNVGTCWRCKTPLEFLKVPQWFIKSVEFRDRVLQMVEDVVWKPEFMKIRIKDWVNSLAWDWVVSQGPNVQWIRRARWVEDGNLWTSSGVSAGST